MSENTIEMFVLESGKKRPVNPEIGQGFEWSQIAGTTPLIAQ